jgi:excisionase family DNA binding protein
MPKIRNVEGARLVTRADAAQRLNVHLRTIDRAIKRGELRGVHVGRRALVAADSIDALIAGEAAP